MGVLLWGGGGYINAGVDTVRGVASNDFQHFGGYGVSSVTAGGVKPIGFS